MATRRPSKAAIRRARADQHAGETPPPPLPDDLAAIANSYVPRSQSPETWEAIGPLVLDVLARSAPQGKEATRQRLLALTRYIAWCHERGYALEREVVLDCELVEAFTDTVDLAKTTAGSYRERLRSIVATVNPTGNGPAVRVSIPVTSVKVVYGGRHPRR